MATHPQPTGPTRFKTLYVRALLRLLPHLINLFRHASNKIQAEIDYLDTGYSFLLEVKGTTLACACRKGEKGSFKRITPQRLARDVEPGSGQPSAIPDAATIDYVIAFRSLEYAFSCFSGGRTLQSALAERAFTTRGPNSTGVALTYMFTALLRLFFFWRPAYRPRPTFTP